MTKEEVKNKVFLNEDKINEVSDKIIQDYEEFTLKEKILSQGLVGEVVGGEYVISDELKQLFVVNKKLLIKRENEFLIAKMDRLGKTFKFRLVFEDFDKDSMVAEFYIMEELGGETIETFIANFIDIKNYEFKQKARESFNILLEEDQYVKDDDEDFAALDKVVERNKKAKRGERIFVLETYSELYIIDMISALTSGGAISKKVLEEYKAEVKKHGLLKPNVPHVYMKLKDILDGVIEKNGGIKVLAQENQNVRKAVERYIVPVKDFDRTSKVIDSLNVKKEEIKEEVKEAPAKAAAKSSGGEKSPSKGGSKSASKPKAKAKPKKKEEKKDDKKKGGVITYVPLLGKKVEKTPVKPSIKKAPIEKNSKPSAPAKPTTLAKPAVPKKSEVKKPETPKKEEEAGKEKEENSKPVASVAEIFAARLGDDIINELKSASKLTSEGSESGTSLNAVLEEEKKEITFTDYKIADPKEIRDVNERVKEQGKTL